MQSVYNFVQPGFVKKGAIEQFCNNFAEQYARSESEGQLTIYNSLFTMDKLKEKFQKLFKCLIEVGRASKKTNMMVPVKKIELMWKDREYYNSEDNNNKLFLLCNY